MRIFARYNLVHGADSPDDELLLEGSWPPAEKRPGRWSLDEAIDARFAWLDPLAMDLAERAGLASRGLTFAYINALDLRYYLVKLLRVIAFFCHVQPVIPHAAQSETFAADVGQAFQPDGRQAGKPDLRFGPSRVRYKKGGRLSLHAAPGDEDYSELLQQLALAHGLELELHWHQLPSAPPAGPRRPPLWRQWAARATLKRPPLISDDLAVGPRVMLCGNPRILNPICAELVKRGARVSWLYERFAARSWWRWRTAGVEQLICETGPRSRSSFRDVSSAEELTVNGIDLARPVDRWLSRRAQEVGHHQSQLVERVDSHFRRIRPTALVVDEDATPLKRIAVAIGRLHGAASMVVQHGAPCGPFGFLPLAADKIAVWGDAARRQLQQWGLPTERIDVAGWPLINAHSLKRPLTPRPTSKRFLLLATMPPRDKRPDNVEFHLTGANYREMLELVYDVLSKIDGATLTIKPHPRDARATTVPGPLWPIAACEGRRMPIKIVRTRDLSKLIAQSDCVLSCASTAGIEAALAGAPVIQLLPAGSGNILPADDWGFIGSARTVQELAWLVDRALARGWRQDSQATAKVLAAHGRAAAARIVDGVLNESCFAVAEAPR